MHLLKNDNNNNNNNNNNNKRFLLAFRFFVLTYVGSRRCLGGLTSALTGCEGCNLSTRTL
jgi:hypothetical protein